MTRGIDTVVHEFGHAYEAALQTRSHPLLRRSSRPDGVACTSMESVSRPSPPTYSATNPQEFFADAFALWFSPRQGDLLSHHGVGSRAPASCPPAGRARDRPSRWSPPGVTHRLSGTRRSHRTPVQGGNPMHTCTKRSRWWLLAAGLVAMAAARLLVAAPARAGVTFPRFDLEAHRGGRDLRHREHAGLVPPRPFHGLVTTLELDIQITRDGVPVIHHDQRLTGETGPQRPAPVDPQGAGGRHPQAHAG